MESTGNEGVEQPDQEEAGTGSGGEGAPAEGGEGDTGSGGEGAPAEGGSAGSEAAKKQAEQLRGG